MRTAFLGFDGCAIWQVALLQMFLANAGWTMDTITADGDEIVTDGGLRLRTTRALVGVRPRDYHLILMAGGDIPRSLVGDPSLQRFLTQSCGIIAASCASAVLVGSAGLIVGDYTCMPHTAERYRDCFPNGHYTGADVCRNNRIVTSQGHAHYEFMMTVLDAVGLVAADEGLSRLALKLSKNQPL